MAIDPRTNTDSEEQDMLDAFDSEDKLWVGYQCFSVNQFCFQHIRLLTILWVVFLVGSFVIFIGKLTCYFQYF